MRLFEFTNDQPVTYALPSLKNQDPYLQYRFGLALAAARAKKEGHIPYEEQSAYGENLIVVAQNKEEQETIAMAMALFGPQAGKKVVVPPIDSPKKKK